MNTRDNTSIAPGGGLAPLTRLLEEAAEPERVPVLQRFFKTGPGEYGDGDLFRGIRVPVLRRIARSFRNLPLDDIDRLLASPYHEDRLVALLILVARYPRAEPREQNAIFQLYLERRDRINNWDLVDVSADRIVGAHLDGSDLGLLSELAASDIIWDRRIAVLATFYFIKKEDFAPTIHIARQLVRDQADLIHKAVGWMLREIGKRDLDVLRQFLDRHAGEMPRTMLRYAIERLAPDERAAHLRRR